MGMFDHFPYTNFHELNLDWILQALKEIEKTMDQFVAINSLKYADPIQWSIIRQYEKNTIVIDPLTGTAYISVQAVPSGVALTNTDYWSVVFDLGSFVVRAAKNFTNRWESETTLTATFSTLAGQWLIWGDTLYIAKVNITAGDAYVIDSNIEHFTIEDLYNTYLNTITSNENNNTTAALSHANGSLLWWKGLLYTALVDINIGDVIIDGTNVSTVNINDWVRGIQTYILSQLTNNMSAIKSAVATDEHDNTTATLSHTNGTLLWWNDLLYMAVVDINVGDAIIDGTNVSRVNINGWVHGIQTYILSQLTTEINTVNNALKVTNATQNPKYITVGSRYCNFNTINEAVDYAKQYCTLDNRITIVIFNGLYRETINLVDNPGIDLLGIGMPIIQCNTATYPEAPLNFSGTMSIEGIEFDNLDTNPTTYAIHYEGLESPDRKYNKVVIRNCVLGCFNSVALGAGLGIGDVFECYNTRFNSYANGAAIRMHPYPIGNEDTAHMLYVGCQFRSGGPYAIDITNERTNGGHTGTSAADVRFISCIADTHNPYIKYTIDSDTKYGYIPTSGEIFLSSESTGNNIYGLNYETVRTTDKYYRVTLPTKPDHVADSWKRYASGIEEPDYEKYDVTFVDASTLDGALTTIGGTLDANIYTNVHGSIGVYGIDDLNNSKYDHLMSGLYVHLRFTPKNV